MQDEPTPVEIMGAVAEFLRSVVAVESNPRTAFIARVASGGDVRAETTAEEREKGKGSGEKKESAGCAKKPKRPRDS